MLVVLDIADEQDDYTAAKSIMVISQTFYINCSEPGASTTGTVANGDGDGDAASTGSDPAASDTRSSALAPVHTPVDGGKPAHAEYFQKRLRRHRLWQNMRFWESAVFESIGSEMAKISSDNRTEVHDRETDVRHGSASVCAGGLWLTGCRCLQITMGQLAFFAFNMINFGLPMSFVQALMDKYAQFVKMEDAQWAFLVGEVQRLAKERDVAEESGALSPVHTRK